jgi:ATP-dependent DNA helicase RecG
VRIFKVEGVERLTGARNNVLELPRVEGGLLDVVERAYQIIGGLVQAPPKLHDLFFRESTRYPTFAWQEALVNALAHRDYRVRGRCVEVWLFDDRMEVISPGSLLPEVDLDRLRRRERQHASRNPCITRVLVEFNLMRDRGEGIPRMFAEMEESLLLLPELRPDAHEFTVVLFSQPIFETPDPAWEKHVRGLPVSTRQKRALVAYPGASFTNAQYQTLNQVDRDTAYREVRELIVLGLVAASGKGGRAARYTVVAPGGGGAPREDAAARELLRDRMAGRGFVDANDYRDAFEVDRSRASRGLAALARGEVLQAEGRHRWRVYRPGPRWAEWASAAQFDGKK